MVKACGRLNLRSPGHDPSFMAYTKVQWTYEQSLDSAPPPASATLQAAAVEILCARARAPQTSRGPPATLGADFG